MLKSGPGEGGFSLRSRFSAESKVPLSIDRWGGIEYNNMEKPPRKGKSGIFIQFSRARYR